MTLDTKRNIAGKLHENNIVDDDCNEDDDDNVNDDLYAQQTWNG